MKLVNISEAKSRLGRILEDVKQGESYTICERNTPVATLMAIENSGGFKIKPGLLKKKFIVPDNFDHPLIEFEKDFYGDV